MNHADDDPDIEYEVGKDFYELSLKGGYFHSSDEAPSAQTRLSRDSVHEYAVRPRPPRKKNVLFIEDDIYFALDFGGILEAYGFGVRYADNVDKALKEARSFRHFDAVVIDIRMSSGFFFGSLETAEGSRTGVILAQELINHLPDSWFVALTNSQDAHVEAWFDAHGFGFVGKKDTTAEKFARYCRMKIMKEKERPRIFIVHGHDHPAALQLKNYIQNTLRLGEPIILQEKPSKGMTIIEKFEHYADQSDIVFALFTPDDFVDDSAKTGRARQNVLFEYGFFLGRLGRRSGKVFLLYKQGVEKPSDLSGIIYIDISNGITAAGEEIRRELEDYL